MFSSYLHSLWPEPPPPLTIFLLSDEVVLGFDVGLKGVEVLALVFLHVGGHTLQDVVGRRGAAAGAALGTAGLGGHGAHVTVLVACPVLLHGPQDTAHTYQIDRPCLKHITRYNSHQSGL